MAILFSELFERIGAIGHIAYQVHTHQAELPTAFETLLDLYSDNHDYSAYLAQSRDSLIQNQSAMLASLAQLGQTTLLRMVQDDVPAVRTLDEALAELVRQMDRDGESVQDTTLSVLATAFTSPANTGTGTVVLTTRRGDGRTQDHMVAEVGRLACVRDSYTGSAESGRESFVYRGQPKKTGKWDYLYPTGSAASAGLTVTDAADEANASGNLLQNSDWEDWSSASAMPTDWTLGVGTITTDFVRSTTSYTGTYAAEFANTATLTRVDQTLDEALLEPRSSYAWNGFLRVTGGGISAGVLVVELVDGSGTVIADDQGVSNTFTITCTALTTTYAAYNTVFRMPAVVPSTVKIRYRVSTAIAGARVLLDHAALGPVTAAYAGGPGIAIFGGSVPFLLGDGWSIESTNSRGGAVYLATFQALFDRLFDTAQRGILLPVGGTPSQDDILITG